MVLELASGNLRDVYTKSEEYTFKQGLKILLGVAKGLAYMHTMPEAVIHRDVKSDNVMVMGDGATGKVQC